MSILNPMPKKNITTSGKTAIFIDPQPSAQPAVAGGVTSGCVH
jgi:hypothetical protein